MIKRHDSKVKYHTGTGFATQQRSQEEIEKLKSDQNRQGSHKNLLKNNKINNSDNSLATSNNDNTNSAARDRHSPFMRRVSNDRRLNIFENMPFEAMQTICHMLTVTSMCKLACTSKKLHSSVINQSDIWKIKIFKRYEVRTGYNYIRNENLIRIDLEMQKLQSDALKYLLKGKWKQKLLIIIWFLFFLFMALIVFPICLIMDESGVDLPLSVIFLPFTISWLLLIVATGSLFYMADKVRTEILEEL